MTMGEKLDKIMTDVAKIIPMVEDHHKTLYGNGDPGIKEKVALIDERQNSCKARIAEGKANSKFNIRASLQTVGVIVAIIMAIYSMTK